MNRGRGEPPSAGAPPSQSSENTPVQERANPGRVEQEGVRKYHGGQDDRSVHLNPEPGGYAPTRSVPAGDEGDAPSLPTSEGDQGFKR